MRDGPLLLYQPGKYQVRVRHASGCRREPKESVGIGRHISKVGLAHRVLRINYKLFGLDVSTHRDKSDSRLVILYHLRDLLLDVGSVHVTALPRMFCWVGSVWFTGSCTTYHNDAYRI